MRISLQPAYVIHRRPYRNTSCLLDAFTPDHGLIALVAKGVRRQSSEQRALLQPFIKLLISFSGRGELFTLTAAELAEPKLSLAGTGLYSGMYVNELLLRVLHRNDPHEVLFASYQKTLQHLATDGNTEPALRKFELSLLAELGYGLQLQQEARSSQPIKPDLLYCYDYESGPIAVANGRAGVPAVSGKCLLAMANGQFTEPALLHEMKLLMRYFIQQLLGGKPLKSRELFVAMDK